MQDVHLQLSSYKDTILSYLSEGGHGGGAHPMGNGAATTTMVGKDSMSMLTLSDSERPSMDHQTNHNLVRDLMKHVHALDRGCAKIFRY